MSDHTRIALGSENPIKRRATERALPSMDIVPVGVDSEVGEQPQGHAATRAGACNRARAAIDRTNLAIGLGIEGGIGTFPDMPETFVIMWAAIAENAALTAASGPGIPLPDHVARRVIAGKTLGAVMRKIDRERADELGAAGVITGGTVDRESTLELTVASAWGRHRAERTTNPD